jgi:hypothetical protein
MRNSVIAPNVFTGVKAEMDYNIRAAVCGGLCAFDSVCIYTIDDINRFLLFAVTSNKSMRRLLTLLLNLLLYRCHYQTAVETI